MLCAAAGAAQVAQVNQRAKRSEQQQLPSIERAPPSYLRQLWHLQADWRHALQSSPLLASRPTEALLRDEDRAFLGKINTNTYVWGEGFQVDPTQDYSNFTPKKVREFQGAEKPNIVDLAFGWYHEAYIDQKGKLYVCAKAKMPSVAVEGLGDRPDMVEVQNLPRGTKVRQVAFTQSRMFVLSEKGDVYLYKVEEHLPSRDEIAQFGKGGPASQIKGELMIYDAPIKIKGIGVIK